MAELARKNRIVHPLIKAQLSKMNGTDDTYLCISMASPNYLQSKRPEDNPISCITLGLLKNNILKRKVKFWNDPSIQGKSVGQTCERCNIVDCKERAAPNIILQEQLQILEKEKALERVFQKQTSRRTRQAQ